MSDDIAALRERIRAECQAAALLAAQCLDYPRRRQHRIEAKVEMVPAALMHAEMAARDAEIAALRRLIAEGQAEYRAARSVLTAVAAAARYVDGVR